MAHSILTQKMLLLLCILELKLWKNYTFRQTIKHFPLSYIIFLDILNKLVNLG